MNADEIVDSYVADVVKRLPRRQRVDVALELRSLLAEELAAAEGSVPTPERTRDLLRAFGRPADVAARYRPPMAAIDPADSRLFWQATAIGVAVIWLLGLLVVAEKAGSLTRGQALQQWWLNAGVTALWWPGFLVVCFAAAAWARRKWPRLAEWKPRPLDRDRVSRIGHGAATVGAIIGTLILANPSIILDHAFGGHAAPEAYAAFAYDDGFVRTLGPALLVVLGAHILLQATLVVRGRWQPLTRRIDIGLTIVTCALLTWILFSGPVFQATPTDQAVRLATIVIVPAALVSVVRKMRNLRLRTALAARQ